MFKGIYTSKSSEEFNKIMKNINFCTYDDSFCSNSRIKEILIDLKNSSLFTKSLEPEYSKVLSIVENPSSNIPGSFNSRTNLLKDLRNKLVDINNYN